MFIQFIFLIIYGALKQPTAALVSPDLNSAMCGGDSQSSPESGSPGVCPMGIELEGEGGVMRRLCLDIRRGLTDTLPNQPLLCVDGQKDTAPAGLEEELQDTLGRQEGRSRKLPYILKRRADRPATHRRPYILRRFINVQIE